MVVKLQVHQIPKILAWKGLIGSRPEAIVFKTRFGIHTIGVGYAIDVVILDKNHVAQKIKENLLPNHFFFWNPQFDTVIELPRGTIKKNKIKIGQKIDLQTF